MSDESPRGPACPSPAGRVCRGLTHPRMCVLAGCGLAGPGDAPDDATRAYYRDHLAHGQAVFVGPEPVVTPRTPMGPRTKGADRPIVRHRAIPADRLALINACEHRGCKTGCGHALCARDHREVHLTDCSACVSGLPRACLVTPSAGVGGAERWMVSLMKETRHLIEWTGVSCTTNENIDPGIIRDLEEYAPVTVGLKSLSAVLARADVAVQWGIDLAELDGWMGDNPPPFMLVSHGVGAWTIKAFINSHRADRLIAVSEAAKRPLPADQRSRCGVIENCVQPDRLEGGRSREQVRAEWGVRPDQKALVMVARLSPEKNPQALADAIGSLHARGHTEWVGVHVGRGWDELPTRLNADRNAPGLVRFPGATRDVAGVYRAADVCVLPSYEEACSIAMLEAWWCGTPLVASAIGLTEEPEHAARCRTVKLGCRGRDVADAVIAELADPQGSARRVAEARAHAREHYSTGAFGERWAREIARLARAEAAIV